MKKNVILHSINGLLDSNLEMEKLEGRLEMLVLSSMFTEHAAKECDSDRPCHTVYCDDTSRPCQPHCGKDT